MTSCTSKGTDSYFELIVKALKDHISSLEKQFRDQQCSIQKLLRKIDQNSCSYSTDTIILPTNVSQCNINKHIGTDHQSDHIICSSVNDSANSDKENMRTLLT